VADFKPSRRAKADLRELTGWGIKRFGKAQAARYLDAIEDVCATLGADPNPGQPCPEFRRRLIRTPCGSHVIYYRRDRGVIRIVRVLHKSHLPSLHL
jgi:toxin ParE1/3/4